jgi:hypothetical protein
MLSSIWVSITGAITGHGRFYVSGLVLQTCAMPFHPDTFAADILTDLLARPSGFQEAITRRSVDSPTIFEWPARQFG